MQDAFNIEGSGQAGPLRRKVPAQQLDLLIERLDSLPALPEAVTEVLNLVSASAGPEALAAAVGGDPAIAARILSLACSRCPDRKPGSIARAVEVLGPEGVRSGVLGMKVLEKTDTDGLDYVQFGTHCVAVACASELLAEALQTRSTAAVQPPVAYTCGLLHDLGKAALDRCLPGSYRRVLSAVAAERGNIARFEHEIIGADHTVAGRRLARQWRLPACVREAVWMHHLPHPPRAPYARTQAAPPVSQSELADAATAALKNPVLVVVVQLADAIVRRMGLGFSGNYTFAQDTEALAAEIGLTGEDVAAVADALPARLEQRPAPAGPSGPKKTGRAGELLYRSALAEAGAELACLNEELSESADALVRQAEALKRLGDLIERVSPTTALPKLCEEIARMFSAIISIEPSQDRPVCAFAACDDNRIALAVRACAHDTSTGGEAIFRFSPSAPVHPSPPEGLCPAGPLVRSLLRDDQTWSDLIDIDSYICLPLIADGRLVGGVLLPGAVAASGAQADLLVMLARITGYILSAAGGRSRADRLAEKLAQVLQHLDQARDALAQSQALAAVGEMAAGAAHEMNNPLAVISGRAQILSGSAKTQKQRDAADLIAQKVEEISDIMTDLMAFAHPEPPRPRAIAVADLLTGVKNRFESQHQHKTDGPVVDISTEPDCPDVLADPGQTGEVLLELLDNAVTASGGRVNIAIRASKRPARPPRVLIQVADDGPGMDEATLASAFTPFFSHRQAGRGRGMGLTRARRCVESNGGRMWLQSTPGDGTTVFVELASAQEKAPKQ